MGSKQVKLENNVIVEELCIAIVRYRYIICGSSIDCWLGKPVMTGEVKLMPPEIGEQ